MMSNRILSAVVIDASIAKTLNAAVPRLVSISSSAYLDAQLLLACVIKQPREYLLTWPDRQLSIMQLEQFERLLQRRAAGEPIAYLLGTKSFWDLELQVTADTLCPRPETELCVTLALAAMSSHEPALVLDVGTGCGAIGLSLARQNPHWQVMATDISLPALLVAQANAKRYRLTNVSFMCADLCVPVNGVVDLIVSNPPYIAVDDPVFVQDTLKFEPKLALVAMDNGLALIKRLVSTASQCLRKQGWLIIEHGAQQGAEVREIFEQADFIKVCSHNDLAGCERVTIGRKP